MRRVKIVYDKPGRIRFRFGARVFSRAQEHGIERHLEKCPFIQRAEARYENGGVLVYYAPKYRGAVLKEAQKLRFSALPAAKPGAIHHVSELDREFRESLTKLVLQRFALRLFLPAPALHLLTLYRAIPFLKKALAVLSKGKLTVAVLDGASIAASLLQRNFGTAGTIMFLLQISGLLEHYTRARTRAVLTDSLAIKADKVWLVEESGDVLIPMAQLRVGNHIRVRAGTSIPVDGKVVSGEAFVNESSMTGEPLAVLRRPGNSVFAGTTVEEGSLEVEVRNLSSDTKISKIIELIDHSESLKAGVQSRAEHLADSIVPFSFLGFGLTWLFTRNLTKAVSVLMVDFSCAIKLSTPIAVISAIREASDHDITVKGGKYLEAFAAADTIVFDKTGTLTHAEPHLENVIAFGGYTEDEILKTAACLEEHFPHSVAKAIVKGAEQKNLRHEEEHAEVEYIVAHGIATTLRGQRAIIGSYHFVAEDEGVLISPEQPVEIDKRSGACSVVYLAIGNKLVGALCISDPPRPEAEKTIDALKKAGFSRIVMLTGDSQKAAEMTAKKLGIPEFRAQVLPEDKHKMVRQMRRAGHKVAMVGDGINDAPALAAADVSAAMSDASDIAKDTADITLRGAKLWELARMRELSTKLMRRIRQNYRFIVGFNATLIVLGLLGVLSPGISAFLHNASTMAICARSMMPLLEKKEEKEENWQ